MMIKKYPVWVTVEQANDIETFLTLLREPIQKNLKKCKLPKVKKDCEIAVNKLNYLIELFEESNVIDEEFFITEEIKENE